MTKTARIFIRVTDELKARIEAAAAALGLDMSAYITMTLTKVMKEETMKLDNNTIIDYQVQVESGEDGWKRYWHRTANIVVEWRPDGSMAYASFPQGTYFSETEMPSEVNERYARIRTAVLG